MSLLFERIKIGNLELKNRMVMPPMGTHFAHADGTVSPRQIEYYARRAQGGVGLVEVEFSAIDPVQVAATTQVRISDDRFTPGLAALATAIKNNGAKAAIQIHHPGRQTSSRITGVQPVAPSALAGASPEVPRELSVEEIRELEERFVQAARRAKVAGFDAVELHGAHGYLLCQFLSPFSNHRQDDYGGDTRRRARFALEIVDRVKQRLGKDFPLIFRFSAHEYVEGGLTPQETGLIARLLEEAGVSAISVSAGNHASMEWAIQPMLLPPGCLAPLAREIKKAVSIPVIAVGRINDPAVAERILEQGKADLVAIGRGLLADPDFPRKAHDGKSREIIKCIACNTCQEQVIRTQPIACLVNPEMGRELEREEKAPRPRRVLILGAGPAGLEAARVAQLQGHDVTLWEENHQPGGHWSWLIRPYIAIQRSRLRELGVKLELGRKPDNASIRALRPGVILVTPRATPKAPPIPGLMQKGVFQAQEALEGKQQMGKRVVVLGAGNIGLEVAYKLSREAAEVTVVEPSPRSGYGLEWHTRKVLLRKLGQRGVKILTNIMVERREGSKLMVRQADKTPLSLEADSFILGLESEPNEELAESLKKDFPVISLPYCERPGDAYRAAQQGAAAVRGI